MNRNASPWIVASAVIVAAAAGVTYAVTQPAAHDTPPPIASSPSAVTQVPASPKPIQSPVASAEPAPVEPAPTEPAPVEPAKETSGAQPPVAHADPALHVQSCSVSMAKVSDPAPPLNVRSGPSSAAKVVDHLQNGTWVTVVDESNGWFQISNPVAGWVSKQRAEYTCNQKVERVSFAPGGNSATLTDRFVGTGSHRYLLRLAKGQRLTLSRDQGPLPSVMAPDGTYLLSGPSDNRTNWNGQLPMSGDYTVALDSNFKGYDYSFFVEVR